MKYILLTRGKQAIVDDEDYDFLNQWKWHCLRAGYAARTDWNKGNRKMIYMHRLVINAPKNSVVDHVNRNKIDNRKQNLCICTHAENMHNCKLNRTSSSGYSGVSYNKLANKWEAYIKVNYKKIHLGLYNTSVEAARIRRGAKIMYSIIRKEVKV